MSNYIDKSYVKLIEINQSNVGLVHEFLLGCSESLKSFRYFQSRDVEQSVRSHDYTIVTKYKDIIVGYGHLDKDGHTTWLGICVADHWRLRGLGKIMMDALTQKFPERKICLAVDVENHIAIALYKKYGFKFIRNFAEDVILMERNV